MSQTKQRYTLSKNSVHVSFTFYSSVNSLSIKYCLCVLIFCLFAGGRGGGLVCWLLWGGFLYVFCVFCYLLLLFVCSCVFEDLFFFWGGGGDGAGKARQSYLILFSNLPIASFVL